MKKIKRIINPEILVTIGAVIVGILFFAWIFFLMSLVFGREDNVWGDARNGLITSVSVFAIAGFCAGCAWMAEHKNKILKVIGSILCFLLFSAFFTGCTALFSLLGS